MVTISSPLGVSQAKSYHKEEFSNDRNNYYSQDGAVRTEWQGRLAQKWDLVGPVSEKQFGLLADGRDPLTGEQLVQHRNSYEYKNAKGETIKTSEHRAGWDATFSAPKTVSLTALVGGDERVRDAHRESVRIALDEMEKYVQARIGGNHPAETTGKWIAAKFEHDSARPVDGYAAPQLHTHTVIFNLTETDDGRTHAMQPRELYKTQQYATAIYQSELAIRLKELGYNLQSGKNGAPEIKGYSAEYIAFNSARRQQIQDHLQQGGYRGAAAAQIAAHRTRGSKHLGDATEMRHRHQEIAVAFGDQPMYVVKAARERGQQHREHTQLQKHARVALTYARDKNMEREAVVEEREIIRDALKRGSGYITFDAVRAEFEGRHKSGEFVDLTREHRTGPGRLWTTQEMLNLERSNIEKMREGQGEYRELTSDKARRSVRQEDLSLSQRHAVDEILTSRDQIMGLQGTAGTGKTSVLSRIREAAEFDGYDVRGLAPTTRAASQLSTAGIRSTTLQHHLVSGENSQGRSPALYVLDESSLASTRQINEFLGRLKECDRVLVVGDARQHQGIEAGRPFQQMQESGMRTAHLDEIVRQKDPLLRAVVEDLSEGKVSAAIDNLKDQGRVHEIANPEERIDTIAQQYMRSPENTLVISPDNKSREVINSAIHLGLQGRGEVSKVEHDSKILVPRQDLTGADRRWAAKYEPGDVVRFSRGSRQFGITAGEQGKVESVGQNENVLTLLKSNGERVTYDPRRLQGVSVYKESERQFAEGDRIQLTAPFKRLEIANREFGKIEIIDKNRNLQIRLDSGRSVEFNMREHPHIDHGYAVTSYSSQGQTADRVLVHVDTSQSEKLINSRFAYVSLSRARYDAQIYTNDAEHLGQELGREVSKSSALDFHESSERNLGHAESQSLVAESAPDEHQGQSVSHDSSE